MSEEDEDGSSALLAVDDKFARRLAGFKEKIHGVVNEWMHHYRKAIGLPDHMISSSAHSSSVSGTPLRGVSSRSRLVKSSMAFIGKKYRKIAIILCNSCWQKVFADSYMYMYV